MRSAYASATCPECQTYFSDLPVDYDEDGYGNALMEHTLTAHNGRVKPEEARAIFITCVIGGKSRAA